MERYINKSYGDNWLIKRKDDEIIILKNGEVYDWDGESELPCILCYLMCDFIRIQMDDANFSGLQVKKIK